MVSARWLALIVFIILGVFIAREKKCNVVQKFICHSTAFLEGMVGGLIIDSIGVNLGYYYFPRQPLYSLNYWLIVIPCWGVFGLLVNYLWERIGEEKFIKGLSVTLLPLFAFYEGSNLITGSWVYTVPFSVVLAGWTPLVLTFTSCRRRRKVVWKIESWKLQYQKSPILVTMFQALKVVVVVVMFPLLLVSMLKVITQLSVLNKREISFGSCIREVLLMEG